MRQKRNPFSTIALKDILHNQTYIGKIQYNKYGKCYPDRF
ncbi:hypothetical protein [uncultured Trichococcus sp.]